MFTTLRAAPPGRGAGIACSDRLFLNRYGEPLGERGVKHALRHTFATAKGQRGVNPFLLKEWMGRRSLNTTQLCVNLGRKNAGKVMEDTSL